MLLFVFSLALTLSSAQWVTQPLQNTLSWNSISSGLASGLSGTQIGYPLLGNGLGTTGTIGAAKFGAFGTTSNYGFAPTTTFPLNSLVGGGFGSTVLMPSSYPMGNVIMPAVQPPPNPNTVGGTTPAETKYYWNQEWAAQQEEDEAAYNPTWRWDQYKDSFIVTQGVPADYNSNAARALLSLDKWWTAIMNTEAMRSLAIPYGGASPPRYSTFPVPGSPSMPVVPCPSGTPEYVCAEAAKNMGMRFPTPPDITEDQSEYMEYAYWQNLVQRRYPGYGPIYPRTPINGQPFRQIGPNPGPFAPRPPLNCDMQLFYYWDSNPATFPGTNGYNRYQQMNAEINYKCACSPTGVPIMSQCTKAVLEEAEELPTAHHHESELGGRGVAAGAKVVGAVGEDGAAVAGAKVIYGVSYPTNFVVQTVTPCGDFATFDPNVPCATLLSDGFTPEPPLRIAGMQSAQPQSSGDGPWWTDPYACPVWIEASIFFDSPFAWDNNYDSSYYIYDENTLECLCDQFRNPILSSCRQGVQDNYPIVPSGPAWAPPVPEPEPEPEQTRRRSAEPKSSREARTEEDEVVRAVREALEAADNAQKAAEYATTLAKRAQSLAKKRTRKTKRTKH